jgi:hypothetical protein
MNRQLFISSLLILAVLYSCEKTESRLNLDIEDNLSFSGSFQLSNYDDITGTISLHIANGYYNCSTNLPFGVGAGKLETTKTTIDFIDTLFVVIPAMYGSTYVPHGKHNYKFNGVDLTIWKELSVGNIEYDLKLTKSN